MHLYLYIALSIEVYLYIALHMITYERKYIYENGKFSRRVMLCYKKNSSVQNDIHIYSKRAIKNIALSFVRFSQNCIASHNIWIGKTTITVNFSLTSHHRYRFEIVISVKVISFSSTRFSLILFTALNNSLLSEKSNENQTSIERVREIKKKPKTNEKNVTIENEQSISVFSLVFLFLALLIVANTTSLSHFSEN